MSNPNPGLDYQIRGCSDSVGRPAAKLSSGICALAILAAVATATAHGSEKESWNSQSDLFEMSLDDLLKQRTELHRSSNTASGTIESIRDVPGSMTVLDSTQLNRRGYDSLDDMLGDLPGFDVITTNGTMHTVAYQRGYRTPWTQRTLFLINGKVDNNLWNHSAQLSRQYPMALIDRVEVLQGPAGAVYGPNSFLGVINVVTKDSSRLSDGKHWVESRLLAGSFESRGVDIGIGGREGAFSYDVGFKLFDSDEPGLDDYSEWGYTQGSLLSDPNHWGAGIGAGIDPDTGTESPAGDIDVDGSLEAGETFLGGHLGAYRDPTHNYGFIGEARLADWELGLIRWKTQEGYGPYYSFADAQPGVAWEHESTQIYLNNDRELSGRASLFSEVVVRSSRVGGEWAESFGDQVSLSSWNSYNEAWRFEQDLSIVLTDELSLSAGWKFEHRDLNKLYVLCNYWLDNNCVDAGGSPGSGVLPADLISSGNPLTKPKEIDDDFLPESNLSHVTDHGAYVQGIWDHGDVRVNAGLRWDQNSDYGPVWNPRLAVVFHSTPRLTYKMAYGESFQEPSPKDLFGGWNGRLSNIDLEPEWARNLEFVATHQGEWLMHDASVYFAEYENAIAGGENTGDREVFGVEYKARFRIANWIGDSQDITGELNYTYTDSVSDRQFNNSSGLWERSVMDTGDIAPHKVNFLLNLPIKKRWNANLGARYVSERELFSQNPLRADSNPARAENRKAEAFTTVNANLRYERERYDIGFRIENLFEEDYLLPGVEAAGSGDDFSADFDGFQNSLIPQVNKRTYTVVVSIKL